MLPSATASDRASAASPNSRNHGRLCWLLMTVRCWWGCPPCQFAFRFFLIVIRRQSMIGGGDELFKKLPCFPGHSSQRLAFFVAQRLIEILDRLTYPEGNRRRATKEQVTAWRLASCGTNQHKQYDCGNSDRRRYDS